MNPRRFAQVVGACVLSVAAGVSWAQAPAPRFDVASVRADDTPFKPPSFALSQDDSFRDPHGRFHADFQVAIYLQFAYKLWLTGEEQKEAFANVPDWVHTQRFDIEATAPLNATKDDYRAMVRALLEERFALKMHFVNKDKPVLAMVLVKEGTPGPRLIPHGQGPPCDDKPTPGIFECYTYGARPDKDGMWLAGSRATTMDLIANFVGSVIGNSGEISRRVVDQTGLTGLWDFTLVAPSPSKNPDAPTPAFTQLDALRDQLGIKLKATHATVSLPVIDHVERPTDN